MSVPPGIVLLTGERGFLGHVPSLAPLISPLFSLGLTRLDGVISEEGYVSWVQVP